MGETSLVGVSAGWPGFPHPSTHISLLSPSLYIIFKAAGLERFILRTLMVEQQVNIGPATSMKDIIFYI